MCKQRFRAKNSGPRKKLDRRTARHVPSEIHAFIKISKKSFAAQNQRSLISRLRRMDGQLDIASDAKVRDQFKQAATYRVRRVRRQPDFDQLGLVSPQRFKLLLQF